MEGEAPDFLLLLLSPPSNFVLCMLPFLHEYSNSNFAHLFEFVALLILQKIPIYGRWFLFGMSL